MPKRAKPHFLRRTFLTGLLILLPLVITYLLIAFLLNLFAQAGAPLAAVLSRLFGAEWYTWWSIWVEPLGPFVNLSLSLTVIFLLGLVGTNLIGRRFLEAFESLLMRLPLVNTIYGAVKQMVENFRGEGRSFQRVVLVQYPRKELWMIGFVAAERRDTLKLSASGQLLAVFIPTTPNPTSGFLVLVAPEDVVDLDYSVEEAFTLIVSSGIVGRDPVPAQHEVFSPAASARPAALS